MQGIFESLEKVLLSRRDFLVKLGWGGIISFLIGSVLATVKFFFPRVLFESPARFTVGKPEDYSFGKVDSSYKNSHTPEGELIVDKSATYKGIPGMNSDVIYPQSLLKVQK
jgi:hypothetical protein